MASPSSNTSSGSSVLRNSGSEKELQEIMDQKKRKRMISNRESARRSRLRKEKHLNDIMAQVNQLKHDNSQMMNTLTLTTQNYYRVEAENNVLRTRMCELSNRLESLNEMLLCLQANNNMSLNMIMNIDNFSNYCLSFEEPQINLDSFISPWNNLNYMNQPILASPDIMLQY